MRLKLYRTVQKYCAKQFETMLLKALIRRIITTWRPVKNGYTQESLSKPQLDNGPRQRMDLMQPTKAIKLGQELRLVPSDKKKLAQRTYWVRKACILAGRQ